MTRTRASPALLAALMVPIAALLTFFVLGPPFYHANDDAVMNCIVDGSGWIGGETHPSERAVFLHVALGRLLVALYRREPAVPWYGLLLLSSVALASFSLIYAGLRLGLRPRHAAVVLTFGALVLFLGVATLHFGVTASLLMGAAVVLGSSLGARRPATSRRTALLGGLALGEALLSGMLRPEACYLGLAAASPLAWMPEIHDDPLTALPSWRRLRRAVQRREYPRENALVSRADPCLARAGAGGRPRR